MLAFLGCLKAGIVAVPCFPPNPARKDTLLMFSRITESSGAKFVLTSHEYNHFKKLAGVKDIFTKFTSSRQQQQQAAATATWPEQLEWIITDSGGGGGKQNKNNRQLPNATKSDLAFLQVRIFCLRHQKRPIFEGLFLVTSQTEYPNFSFPNYA